jgi:adenosyl cobinamide kinase/adenosyl cobinamide phosphate guanylyltransferase
MMTKEVNEWIKKVKTGNYSSWDIMEEFAHFAKYLTKEEIKQVKTRLDSSVRK